MAFRGYWDCPNCGRIDIPGDTPRCPGCGGSPNTFHPTPRGNPDAPKHYVREGSEEYRRAKAGPNWICSYCGGSNSATLKTCPGCGHSRDSDDRNYFQHHPDRKSTIFPGHEDDDLHASTSTQDEDDDEEDHQSYSGSSYFPSNSYSSDSYSSPRHDYDHRGPEIETFGDRVGAFLQDHWGFIIGALAAVLAIIGLVFLFMPKERYITVTDISWTRSVAIENYRTVRESDWSVPSGGRVQYTTQDIHHYRNQYVRTDHVQKSRYVKVGSHEEFVGYKDLGNGYFDEEYRTVDDYGWEDYWEDVDVYEQVPVYQTKYHYDIERWVYDHTETSSGHDHEAYWPEYTPPDTTYRTGDRSESYTVTAFYEDNDPESYTVSYTDWCGINVDDQLHVKVHFGGRIELISPEDEDDGE